MQPTRMVKDWYETSRLPWVDHEDNKKGESAFYKGGLSLYLSIGIRKHGRVRAVLAWPLSSRGNERTISELPRVGGVTFLFA